MGWVDEGDTVIDPFGGIALGAFYATGLIWIGVELEKKLVDFGQENIKLWNAQDRATIICGDSRNLKEMIEQADLVVSSPPFLNQFPAHDKQENYSGFEHVGSVQNKSTGYRYADNTPGNLANMKEDSFWLVSKEIVQGCYDLLKSKGHAIWVTKNSVKNKKIVPFSNRWLSLCISVGFNLVCRHKAMLVKTSKGLFMETITERKSFFRKLAESKGSPKIDYEDVLCLVKT